MKRSVVRGVLSAIISHYLVLFGLLIIYRLLCPFVWAAIYGAPYQRGTGAMDPNSGKWLIFQAISFLSWIAGGYAACRWDYKNSNRAVWIVGSIYMVLALLGGTPVSMETVRKVFFYLEIPISIYTGWYMNRYLDAKRGQIPEDGVSKTTCETA
jgi:hypothetical protein